MYARYIPAPNLTDAYKCGHIGHNAINKDNDPKCRGCSRSSQK